MSAPDSYTDEYHVSVNGDDGNDGRSETPLRTISEAASLAQPGDEVIVHEGTYRERVTPPRGGQSDDKRIVYRAADEATVAIKGSEVVDGWERGRDNLWKRTLENSFFGEYNPYADIVRGNWFDDRGRDHHTGGVYLNGSSLRETASLDDVQNDEDDRLTWYSDVDEDSTTIWAQFGSANPNQETIEINVRPTVFYPDEPGVNYITVRGFTLRHAATQWAPPTTEQIGLLGTHWSKGWTIENNIISDSRCTGITLGKYGDWRSEDRHEQSAEGYSQAIHDALKNGWEKSRVGAHLVRNNTIHDCGQAGICGSMGCAFSEIANNHVYDINAHGQLSGDELAGIKVHGAIDTMIRDNCVHDAPYGIWLDWMAQGTRVSGNLLYNNGPRSDLYLEVNHGPSIADNNVLLSENALRIRSQGGAYVHNLIAGDVERGAVRPRSTPFHVPHSTSIAGNSNIDGGDDRFYNNVFVGGTGLSAYDDAERPVWMNGNVFFDGATPSEHEPTAVNEPDCSPTVELFEERDTKILYTDINRDMLDRADTELVTTDLLGRAAVPDAPYQNPDGTPLYIETDYFGDERRSDGPYPGPLACPENGPRYVTLWPR